MSKKPKREKSPKVKSGGNAGRGGQDPVTGLYADNNGQRIESDKVYSQLNDPEAKGFFAARESRVFASGGSAEFEFEMGKTAIILTSRVTGEQSVDGLPQSSKQYQQRVAWIGNFEYDKNGRLKSGIIRELTEWTHGSSWLDDSTHEWSSIDTGSTTKAQSLLGVFASANSFTTRIYDYLADYANNIVIGGPKSEFYNFESSKYFEDGWWNNPFATNLT